MASVTLSIIVEWENVQNSEASRADRMLSAVRNQIRDLPSDVERPVEVLLVHPKSGASAPPARLPSDADCTIGYLEVEGLDYYSQKNAGAARATGDLLLFVDSDVVPEEGWMASLVGGYLEARPDAACGQTYLEAEGAYAHAMSSFWIFPNRAFLAPDGPPTRETRFYANNLLLSRKTFVKRNFPETPEIRGRCLALADAILADEGRILQIPQAKVSHPAPNGLKHFLKRAMSDGHDAVVRRSSFMPTALVDRYLRQSVRGVRNVWRQGRRAGFAERTLILMTAVPLSYYLAAFTGELSARVAPRWTRNRIRV